MGELASTLMKLIFRLGIILAGITAFVFILNFLYSALRVALDGNILSDMYGIINIWMPFNLSSLLAWLMTGASLYMAYRLTVIAVNYMSRFTA